MVPPPSSHPNSKLKQPTMSSSAAAAFMTDMLTYQQASPLSAFHSAPLKPYMAPPSSASLKAASPSAPSTSIAKPIPMAHTMAPVTKVVTMDRETTQPAFSTGGEGGGAKSSQGVTVASSAEGGGVKGEGLATMLSQSYYHSSSPQVINSLSKMLLAPSPPQEHQEQVTSGSGGWVGRGGGGEPSC